MSSLRKAVYRRNHPERPQPLARAKLGILEKHKDYVERAKNRHKKEDTIKKLKEKARLRNKDEFYFSMVRSETSNGVHITNRDDKLPEKTVRLIKDQHLGYINQRESANKKRLEELRSSIHVTSILRDEPAPDDHPLSSCNPKHIIFVDDDSEKVHASEYTIAPSLSEDGPSDKNEAVGKSVRIYANALKKSKDEFYKRLELEKKLKDVQSEYQLRKNLRSKGARIIIGKDARGLRRYAWKQCRKR